MATSDYEQLELPLEFATHDHYHIEIRKGDLHQERPLRHHDVRDVDAAVSLIEGLRDTYAQRENVTWQSEEVNEDGRLYGLAPGPEAAEVWMISVEPPLSTPLS
jgi:hypothetical protein